MKKEIDAETKKAAEADRKHKASAAAARRKTVSAKMEKAKATTRRPRRASGPKMSAAQTKQLGEAARRLPQAAPGRALEERRRAAQRADAHTALTFAAGAAANSSRLAACAGAGAGLPSRSAMICARAA